MATIVTRSGKGSPLTNAEVDANFTNLNTELGSHNHDGQYIKEGGTSFSGEYPVAVRVGANNFYSDANIRFEGATSKLTVDGSVNSPIFYDSNNTAYYGDFASISRLNKVQAISLNVDGTTDPGGAGLRIIGNYSGDHTWLIHSGARWVFARAHDWTQSFDLFLDNATNGTNSGWAEFGQRASNSANGTWRGVSIRKLEGSANVLGDLQAGASYLNTLNINGAAEHTSSDNTGVVYGGPTPNKLWVNGSIQLAGNSDAIVFGRGTASFLKDEELGFGWGGGWYMQDSSYLRVRNNKSVFSTGDARFSIFYDSANTAFYWNPNDNNAHKFQTPSGYVHIGPMNTSHCHISTDRSNFYFNNEIRVDSGLIGSYNEDLQLRRAVNDAHKITIGAGTTTVSQNTVVQGTVQHNGLVMTSGTNVDQLYTHTFSMTLTTGWQDVGISGSMLPTGSYIVQISDVTDYGVGGGQYYEFYTGVMSWTAGGTNDTSWDEIPLHSVGHADNDRTLYLRTLRRASSTMTLQMAGDGTNTAAYTYTIKFRRMI